jgi:hypothetical protein
MWRYAKFYCEQDVRISKEGFMQFREDFIKAYKLDPFNFLTISSISYQVFKDDVFCPNKNLFEIGGIVRLFCAKAIH